MRALSGYFARNAHPLDAYRHRGFGRHKDYLTRHHPHLTWHSLQFYCFST